MREINRLTVYTFSKHSSGVLYVLEHIVLLMCWRQTHFTDRETEALDCPKLYRKRPCFKRQNQAKTVFYLLGFIVKDRLCHGCGGKDGTVTLCSSRSGNKNMNRSLSKTMYGIGL